jgi:hypothetical protein
MEIIFNFVEIIGSIGISLGVGASTIAIVSFFVALSDGGISVDERKMLGVVYIMLRVAMGIILFTSLLTSLTHFSSGFVGHFTPFITAKWILIGVLFSNAMLMTKHIMPPTIGPALQAGTWYTLGIITALIPLGLAQFSLIEFFVGYAAALSLSIAVVNTVMGILKAKK